MSGCTCGLASFLIAVFPTVFLCFCKRTVASRHILRYNNKFGASSARHYAKNLLEGFALKTDHLELLTSGAPISTRQQIGLALRLSWPAIMAQLATIVMQFIDAAMVGRLGAAQSASVGLMASATWLFNGLGHGCRHRLQRADSPARGRRTAGGSTEHYEAGHRPDAAFQLRAGSAGGVPVLAAAPGCSERSRRYGRMPPRTYWYMACFCPPGSWIM